MSGGGACLVGGGACRAEDSRAGAAYRPLADSRPPRKKCPSVRALKRILWFSGLFAGGGWRRRERM